MQIVFQRVELSAQDELDKYLKVDRLLMFFRKCGIAVQGIGTVRFLPVEPAFTVKQFLETGEDRIFPDPFFFRESQILFIILIKIGVGFFQQSAFELFRLFVLDRRDMRLFRKLLDQPFLL